MRPNHLAEADRRASLRRTFESAADTYEAARPAYPDALYDDLVELAILHAARTRS
jgi:hypothetical protein